MMSVLRLRDMVIRMQAEASVRKVIPLFPLGTVLFSGGRLPLRIFEPRYTAMVSRCLREKSGFGVVLIREGSDARLGKNPSQPEIFSVGTYGTIVDFNTLNNGMLGIITSGGPKFRILETSETSDHLLMGTVEFLPEERAQATGRRTRLADRNVARTDEAPDGAEAGARRRLSRRALGVVAPRRNCCRWNPRSSRVCCR